MFTMPAPEKVKSAVSFDGLGMNAAYLSPLRYRMLMFMSIVKRPKSSRMRSGKPAVREKSVLLGTTSTRSTAASAISLCAYW